jgi:CheY-like chemotaxis protein
MQMAYQEQKWVFLVADDDPEDQIMIYEALKLLTANLDLRFVQSSSQVLEYLRNSGPDQPEPRLIFLDLNMPGTDGRALLKELKADPAMKAIPVAVLTGSKAAEDAEFCQQAGAAGYYQKPSSFLELARMVDQLLAEQLKPWYPM